MSATADSKDFSVVGSMLASDLLASKVKKFTMDMPVGMHQKLKMIAASRNTTVRNLVMEAVTVYTIPTYTKDAK